MVKKIYSKNILNTQIYNLNSVGNSNFPTPENTTFQFGIGATTRGKNWFIISIKE